MDDAHGATRHLIARAVFLDLVAGVADDPDRDVKALARFAWLAADAFVAESILQPHERAALKETN